MISVKGFVVFILFILGTIGATLIMHNIYLVEDYTYPVSNIVLANEPEIEFSPSVAFHSGFLFCLGLILFIIYLQFKVRIAGELSILIGIYVFYTMVGVFDIISRLKFHLFTMSMAVILWTEFFGYLLRFRRLITDLVPYILTFTSLGIILAGNTTHLIYAVLYFPIIIAIYFMIITLYLLLTNIKHRNFYLFVNSIVITSVSCICWILSRNRFHWNRIGWTIFLVGFSLIFFLSDWRVRKNIFNEEDDDNRVEIEEVMQRDLDSVT